MPHFICNHLQPSATLVLFVAEAATLLAAQAAFKIISKHQLADRVADEQSSATLSATAQL